MKKLKSKAITLDQKSQRNFVAKHMNDFNHSTVMVDRKKELSKRGGSKKHRIDYKKDHYGPF